MLFEIVFEKAVQGSRDWHADQHAKYAEYAAANGNSSQNPDSGQADGGTNDPRIDQIPFQLLEDDEKD